MTAAKQPSEQNHLIAERLHEMDITSAAIIDDAYDPLTLDTLRDEVEDFWHEINNKKNKEMRYEFDSFGFELESPDDINDDVLQKLWELRNDMSALRATCDNILFSKRIEMLHELEPFCKHLDCLGLELVQLGVEDDLPDPSIKLIFLDYVLNPDQIEDIGDLAKGKATAIYHQAKEHKVDKPFIVLMSSREGVGSLADDFRETSRLLGALFGFMPKEDLCNQEKLYLRLGSWGIGNPTHHEIQSFVDAVVESVDSISKDFKQILRKLDIQDYTFIQRLSLHKDGHPLGDYILWLFESTLSYIFRDYAKVRQKQEKLDALKFNKFLPCQNQPSVELARIYKHAVTEPTAKVLGAHPHDESNTQPLLQLGYIFIKDENTDLLMVINAACDLSFAPAASRKISPEQSIYLIPGRLVQLHQRDYEPELIRTELFEYEENVYRIIWNHKRAIPIEYNKIWSWILDKGYSLRARLRLPYALQVQQMFAAHLVRIGMPVPPPIYNMADIEVYCKGEDNKFNLIGEPIVNGAVIIHGKDSEHFVLTVECVNIILDRLDEIVLRIKGQKELLNKQHKQNKVKAIMNKAEKLLKHKTDSQIWLEFVENPTPLPKVGKKKVLHAKMPWVYRDGNFEGKYTSNVPITLNIKFTENPSKLDTPSADILDKKEADTSLEHHGVDQGSVKKVVKYRRHIERTISRLRGWFQSLVC
ncbi:hypothetical protein ACFL0O_08940 [Thermodesulfobacteriota bacterium]